MAHNGLQTAQLAKGGMIYATHGVCHQKAGGVDTQANEDSHMPATRRETTDTMPGGGKDSTRHGVRGENAIQPHCSLRERDVASTPEGAHEGMAVGREDVC